MKELVDEGKQIVMASHDEFDNSKYPDELANNITVYPLNYDLDPPDLYFNDQYNIKYIK